MALLEESPWKCLLPRSGDDRAALHLKLQRLRELKLVRLAANHNEVLAIEMQCMAGCVTRWPFTYACR